MKFLYVYVLRSLIKNFIYVGFTKDLRLRFKQHNNKEELSTKHYAPFEIIHYEAYRDIKDAKRREEYFKTTKGKVTLKLMLKEFLKDSDKPKSAITCPICGGRGEAPSETNFQHGKRVPGDLSICKTCMGKGWIELKESELDYNL